MFMTTRFVDTNILLEAYLRQGERAEKSLQLLKSGKNLLTSWMVIGEFEWVLRSVYELAKPEIVKLLGSVVSLADLEVPDKKLLVRALRLFEGLNVDWTDCLNAILAKNAGAGEIYSYDRDFDKFPGVKRLEP